VQLTSQLAIHTESYPAVQQLEALIKSIQDKLNTEVSKIVSTQQVLHNPVYDALAQQRIAAVTAVLALQAKREAVTRALAAQTQTLPAAAQSQMDMARLSRSTQVLSQELTDLQGRLAQARLREQEVQSLGSLTVLDQARSAEQSAFAGLKFKLTLGLILGLLGGLGLAFFLEYLDNSLKTPEAAERLLGVPALVAIPFHNPPFDEAYRMLRINLSAHERNALSNGGSADVVLFTAPRPRSGTSTVVFNLARAFAQRGRRVVVVDAAFAKPSQHRLFNVPNERGLGQVLAGDASIDDVLVSAERDIWVVPAGPEIAQAGMLLGSPAMADLLATLRRRGDVVLFDTSPAGAVGDAYDLAPYTSGVLLVLDASRAPRGIEEQIKLQFDRLRVTVLGTVITKVAPNLVDSYYYQEQFYRQLPQHRLLPAPTSSAVVALIVVAGLAAGMAAGIRSDERARSVAPGLLGAVAATVQAVEQRAGLADSRR